MDSFHSWSWKEVDPSGHTFDLGAVESVIAPLLPAILDEDTEHEELVRIETLVQCELMAHFGAWIQGWRWTARDWGGPVQAWNDCHSLIYDEDDEVAPPLPRLLRAAQQWQEFLVDVADHMVDEPASCAEEKLEKAALRLLPVVVKHTEVNDAWYNTFQNVMVWYLEAQVCGATAQSVNAVIGGCFQSWCAPLPLETAATCQQWGREVVRQLETPPAARDALKLWLEWRGSPCDVTLWRDRKRQKPLERRRDGHLHYVREVKRDERMAEALRISRAWADSGRAMSLEELQGWQKIVLGNAAPLRTTAAFAKGGRECYGYPFEDEFLRGLDEIHDLQSPTAYRAARAYLDICFFHPFEDGNARSARLLLDALLWREGLTLFVVEPVFQISRLVDFWATWRLADLVDSLLCPVPGVCRAQ